MTVVVVRHDSSGDAAAEQKQTGSRRESEELTAAASRSGLRGGRIAVLERGVGGQGVLHKSIDVGQRSVWGQCRVRGLQPGQQLVVIH
jgi:hypothetical protein